jgi:hypothetical protein
MFLTSLSSFGFSQGTMLLLSVLYAALASFFVYKYLHNSLSTYGLLLIAIVLFDIVYNYMYYSYNKNNNTITNTNTNTRLTMPNSVKQAPVNNQNLLCSPYSNVVAMTEQKPQYSKLLTMTEQKPPCSPVAITPLNTAPTSSLKPQEIQTNCTNNEQSPRNDGGDCVDGVCPRYPSVPFCDRISPHYSNITNPIIQEVQDDLINCNSSKHKVRLSNHIRDTEVLSEYGDYVAPLTRAGMEIKILECDEMTEFPCSDHMKIEVRDY